MQLKIKVRPEDFIVEEIADLPLATKGSFGLYLFKKEGRNTAELLREISRKLNIPFKDFSYGGRKDRHSISSQYITIKNHKGISLKEKKYSLEFIGAIQRPMGPDLIKENKFALTVRNLERDIIDKITAEIEGIKLGGFANYFDDQRFGSFDLKQGFLAEKLLKKQFNGALKIYLTGIYSSDKKGERERKIFFFQNWRNWQACGKKAKTAIEKKAFDYLCLRPNGFLDLLKEIPRHQLSIFISAYQAFLWNEMLRRFIKAASSGPFKTYPGLTGEYIFPEHLEGVGIPVPGEKAKNEESLIKDIYTDVLADNGIKNSMFNNLKTRQAFFKSFPRRTIVKPQVLNFEFLDDELYSGKIKLFLEFSLPSGSYATMLIKRIFSKGG